MRRLMFVAPVVSVILLNGQPRAQPSDDVKTLLQRAASYLKEYEEKLGALIAKEVYVQNSGLTRRMLRAEILFIRDNEYGWVEFRDVLQVDGTDVENRHGRVLDLLAKPHPDRWAQARRVAAEGARFNLNSGSSTVNYPLVGLRFLRGPDQYRSAFTLAAGRRSSPSTVTLDFEEHALPRLIRNPDGLPARGRFVLEPDTGRVLSTELTLPMIRTVAVMNTTFALEPRLQLWLPRRMDERYVGGGLTGHAEYSDYRQFRVDTSTEIGKSPN